MLAISYITAYFLFASAKYLFTQNCKAPSGVEIFEGFSQSELKQDADLARRDLAKDAKNTRRRAYDFGSLRLYCTAFLPFLQEEKTKYFTILCACGTMDARKGE